MAVTNPIAPFLWGSGGAALSPEQVAREREIAAALMQGGVDYSPVDHWMQGLARAAQAGVGALKGRWADEAETAGREGFQSQWDSVFGGGTSPVASALAGGGAVNTAAYQATPTTQYEYTDAGLPRDPDTGYLMAETDPRYDEAIRLRDSQTGGGDVSSYIKSGLISRGLPEHVADAFLMNMQDESGLNPGINEAQPLVPGSRGGYGLYQLTGPRRVAYEQYAQQRGVDPSDIDAQLDFMMTELQGPEARAYQSIMAAPDTGSAAAAIVNNFLRPAEEHRARREAAYLGGGGAAPAQVAQGPDMAALLGLAGNQWASPQQQAVVQALMGQQIQQQDPMYQLQRQKAELELEAMRNPAAPAPVWEGGQWWDISSGMPTALTEAAPSTSFNTITIDVPGVGPQTFNTADPAQWQMANQLLANGATEVKTPGVSVSVGGSAPAPAQGYQNIYDEAGRLVRQELIPGSPAALAAEQADAAAEVRAGQQDTATGIITSAAQKARDALHSGALTTGLPGNIAAIDPSSQAAELRRQLGVLTSNATMQNLNAMKAASPTGSALGAVSDREGAMLAAMSGALDPSSPNFETDLDEYERVLLEVIHGPEMGRQIYEQTRPPPRVGQIVNSDDGRYRYLGGDLGDPSSWEKVQ